MRQAVLVSPRQFELQDVVEAPVGPDDVAVSVHTCGVCASELGAWQHGENAPRLLGHEVAGDVIAVGDRVGTFKVGDVVTGLFNKGFADRAVTTADRVALIPHGIRREHAFGEPLACAVSAALRTRVELGDRIAVVGLGFMGLLMMQLLRLKGPASVTGIDLRDDALASAKRLGADIAIRPEGIDASDRASRIGDKGGFDVVVEATGTQPGLTLASELVREHGVLSILGYHQRGPRQVDMQLWNFKAFDVVNAHERRPAFRMECMKRGLALAAAGRIELASLVTHIYSLSDVGEAFSSLESKPQGFIKSIVVSSDTN